MSSPFDGKVAIVTGAASGIGAASARRLAKDGAHVVLTDVADEAGRALSEEISGSYQHLDVGDPEAWSALGADLKRAHGTIDLAHLNAGIALGEYPLRVDTMDDDDYRRIMAVNVDGVFFGIRALVPVMAARGGAIVVTASLAGVGPHFDDPVYAGTKHFVVGLVRSLGPPLAQQGITINAVCPGAVDTPLLDTVGSREAIRARARTLMDPSDVADVVADLLAGEETGEIYTVMQGVGERFEFPWIRGMPRPEKYQA
jgi:NAD(P)-dependent dehydrogenase (short-subunit alcohol dehydrogenase family)